MPSVFRSAACAAAVVFSFALSPAADAALASRGNAVNAVGACQGALPSFEGSLRKRPLVIANEGTTPAFVSCSLLGDRWAQDWVSKVEVFFDNPGPGTRAVTCTLVDNYFGANNRYLTKTVSIPAGQQFPRLTFLGSETEVGRLNYIVSFSCNLPPGVSITHMYNEFQVNVGN